MCCRTWKNEFLKFWLQFEQQKGNNFYNIDCTYEEWEEALDKIRLKVIRNNSTELVTLEEF